MLTQPILRVGLFLVMFQALSGGSLPAHAADRPLVYTVNYPLQYFAQRIAGADADVVLPVPADVDPAFWKPDTESILALQRADLILLNGAGYAKWLDKVSLPSHKLIDTSAGFRDRYINVQAGVAHSHGPQGEHSHRGTASTTWLDLSQAAEQARAVKNALSRLIPAREKTFAANFSALAQELDKLDTKMKTIVARDPSQPLLASHPVYQYLARRYSLNIRSVTWEPDSMPPDREWLGVEALLREQPARWMLWEASPMTGIAERLLQAGVQATVFDPCANRPQEGDFMSVMAANIASLERVFADTVEQ